MLCPIFVYCIETASEDQTLMTGWIVGISLAAVIVFLMALCFSLSVVLLARRFGT